MIGVNNQYVAVSVQASEWEFAMQDAFAKHDRFVVHGRKLSSDEIAPEQPEVSHCPIHCRGVCLMRCQEQQHALATHCNIRIHGKPLSARRKRLGGRVAPIQA